MVRRKVGKQTTKPSRPFTFTKEMKSLRIVFPPRALQNHHHQVHHPRPRPVRPVRPQTLTLTAQDTVAAWKATNKLSVAT